MNTTSPTPLVSVIIPVFNAEKYIGVCLDSMIAQTMQSMEVLCVNDGSTDNTLSILDEYVAKDPRIKVITQKNGRSAAARNKGLEEAQGTYIMFCDSDDLYAPETCQAMYDCMEKHQVDFAMYNTLVKYSDGKVTQPAHYFVLPEGKYDLDTEVKFQTNIYVWNKIFKKSLIDQYGMRYPVGHQSDDDAFVYQYLMVAKTAYFLNRNFYTRLMHEDSIMGAYWGMGTRYPLVQDHVDICEFVYDYAIRNNLFEQNKDYFKKFFFNELFYSWIYVKDGWEEQYITRCIEVVKKTGLLSWSPNIDEQQIFDAFTARDISFAIKALDSILNKCGRHRRAYIGKDSVTPTDADNLVSIVLTPSDQSIAWTAVTIQSILKNASANKNYELLIVEEQLLYSHQLLLREMVSQISNFTLKFINLSDQLTPYEVLRECDLHIYSPFLRFFLPRIFSKYSYLIFLSSGVIVEQDVANLISHNLLSKHPVIANAPNASVLAFHTPSYLESDFLPKLTNYVQQIGSEQDIDETTLEALSIPQLSSTHYRTFATEYPSIASLFSATILSYPQPVSLENQEFTSFSTYWWSIAKETPYYEQCLSAVEGFIQDEKLQLLWATEHLFSLRLKRIRYAIKRSLAKGAKKGKYTLRYQKIKQFYRAVKEFKRNNRLN